MANARDKDETASAGAVELDASPLDGRDAPVQRPLPHVEQSIEAALAPLTLAPNDEATWATAVTTVTSLLERLRAEGGLAGATASDAFSVECGLGSTMILDDILNRFMIVQVILQMVHPLELIKLTIKMRMQGA
jgi:hypothetical protein